MKRFLVISTLIALPCFAFAQGNSSDTPGKEKGSGQSAKQFSPGQEKGSGKSAKPYAPGAENKNQAMPANKGKHGKSNK